VFPVTEILKTELSQQFMLERNALIGSFAQRTTGRAQPLVLPHVPEEPVCHQDPLSMEISRLPYRLS